jgi:hypothetical protein
VRVPGAGAFRRGTRPPPLYSADGDIHHSVEVQLVEVDASHSFRVFDY